MGLGTLTQPQCGTNDILKHKKCESAEKAKWGHTPENQRNVSMLSLRDMYSSCISLFIFAFAIIILFMFY